MKLVFLDSTIHEDSVGGAQIFLPSLLVGLASLGHEVHLVTAGQPNFVLRKALTDPGIRLHTKFWKDWHLPTDKAKRLAEWLNHLRPELYIVSVSADVGWLALPYLHPSIRTVAIAHSNTDAFYLPAAHYRQFLSGVIGVSDEICRKFESVAGIPRDRIEWIPYGVRAAESVPAVKNMEPIRIIYVGRLEEEHKRISDVCAIASQLYHAGTSFSWCIVGDGSRRSWMETTLSAEIESGMVRFLGWVANESIQSLLSESEVFILTSDSEGFSIALTEAMANGCCPVVTDIPSGSTQLIRNGVNGFLLPVGDVKGFASKITELANDRMQLQRMRESAWETGRQFSVKKMVDRYDSLFEKTVRLIPESDRKAIHDFPVLSTCKSRYPDFLRRVRLWSKGVVKRIN